MPSSEFTHDVVVIGGGGHVGLPLAIAFAEQGCVRRRLRRQPTRR